MFPGSEKLFRRNSAAGGQKFMETQVAAGSAEQIRVSSARIHFLSAGIKCKKSGAENVFCECILRYFNKQRDRFAKRRRE